DIVEAERGRAQGGEEIRAGGAAQRGQRHRPALEVGWPLYLAGIEQVLAYEEAAGVAAAGDARLVGDDLHGDAALDGVEEAGAAAARRRVEGARGEGGDRVGGAAHGLPVDDQPLLFEIPPVGRD